MSNFRVTFAQDDGAIAIVVPAPGVSVEDAAKAVPAGKAYDVVDVADIPSDRTFRNAWCPCAVNKVRVDIDKAKGICHDKRRAKRAAEFAPLDVEATIPAKAAEAEAKRQQVRDKYATIQANIDAAADVATLKTIVDTL